MRIDQVRVEASILSWSNLAPFVSGQAAKAVAVFPIIGYLILFNDSVAELVEFDRLTGGIGTYLTGKVRLQLLYFGLVLLALCAVWFQLRAPMVVKNAFNSLEYRRFAFSDWSAYEIVKVYFDLEGRFGFGKFDDTQYTRQDLANFFYRACGKSWMPDVNDTIEEYWLHKSSIKSLTEAKEFHKEFLYELAEAKYDYDQHVKKREGQLLFILTITAYVVLSIPSMDVFVAVSAEALGFRTLN